MGMGSSREVEIERSFLIVSVGGYLYTDSTCRAKLIDWELEMRGKLIRSGETNYIQRDWYLLYP